MQRPDELDLGIELDLGAYMQAQLLTEAERAAAERYRGPDQVMRDTASSAWLARLEAERPS